MVTSKPITRNEEYVTQVQPPAMDAFLNIIVKISIEKTTSDSE
jgi:hypothetical protein